jgi:hypothetical protein
MTDAIDDVKMWLILGSMGHAVESTRNGWAYTVCAVYTPNGTLTPEKPKRVCSCCRQRLAMATAFDEKG